MNSALANTHSPTKDITTDPGEIETGDTLAQKLLYPVESYAPAEIHHKALSFSSDGPRSPKTNLETWMLLR